MSRLLLLTLAACTPSPEKVCTHYQQLDDQDPMLRIGKNPPHPSSKLASCTRQLTSLRSVDPAQYERVAHCISKANNSVAAWDCYVGDSVSPKDVAATATLAQCDRACAANQTGCRTTCESKSSGEPLDALNACTDACEDIHSQCVTKCNFP